MKQGHILATFLLIYLLCVFAAWREQLEYDALVREKQKMKQALQTAVDTAANQILMDQIASPDTCLALAELTFFETLYASLGILNQQEQQEQLSLCITCIALLREDGFYLCRWQEKVGEEGVVKQRAWTELQEYCEMSFPAHSVKTDTPVLVVVYQGTEYDKYTGSLAATAKITRRESYVVEIPQYGGQLYAFYHRSGCSNIGKYGRVLMQSKSEEEAILKYGCYKCPQCIK